MWMNRVMCKQHLKKNNSKRLKKMYNSVAQQLRLRKLPDSPGSFLEEI